MNDHKNLLIHLGEALERYRAERRESAPPAEATPTPRGESKARRILRWWMPNPGTLVLVLALLFAVPALARNAAAPAASSVTTIPYQGRLADINGNPVTDRVNMEFRLYDVPTGGTPLWEEFWTGGNAVNVSDGLFSVMLGSINTNLAQTVQGHDTLYLGITVGTDSEMSPRVQLGSVPFSVWSLTVADGSITAAKIAAGAVGSDAIADGAVGSAKLNLQNDFQRILTPVSITTSEAFGVGVAIPDTAMTINLDRPSRILYMARGVVFFDYLTGENIVYLRLDGGDVQDFIVQGVPKTTFDITTFLDLDAGTHTLELYYAAQESGATLTMQGWSHRSSIGYIVFDEN